MAGAVLALIGETACFVVNAVSCLAAIYMLLVMRPRARDPNRRKGTMREAMQYLQKFPPARWLLLTVAAASFCLAPMMTFMPVYAKGIFHGGPDALGFLMGASGVGAVIGGVYLANRRTVIGLDARIGTGCLATGVALLAFAYNSLFLVALPILVLAGTSAILVVTASNMLLQHLVPEHLRGRVMAFLTMSFFGMLPLSALVAGGLALVIGVQPVFVLAGFGAIAVGYALRQQLPRLRELARPVLAEKGPLSS